MPELPEVETIKRQLQNRVVGRKLKGAEIRLPKLVYFDGKKGDTPNFKKHLIGATIKKIDRRAKILIFRLSNNYSLLLHLKMTGQLIFCDQSGKTIQGGHGWPKADVKIPNRWTHIIIYFTDGSTLYFNDLRQFGYMKLVPTAKLAEQPELKNLGPEPFDKNFTTSTFQKMLLRRPRAKIKQLLMDQNFLSGIGNIYADESLFYAGVLPTRPAEKLTPPEIKKLYQGIKTILKKAIAKGGTSANTYVMLSGQKGGYEPYLKVYGKEGEKCPNKCGGKVQRIKLAGRSAHFCPKCQT